MNHDKGQEHSLGPWSKTTDDQQEPTEAYIWSAADELVATVYTATDAELILNAPALAAQNKALRHGLERMVDICACQYDTIPHSDGCLMCRPARALLKETV